MTDQEPDLGEFEAIDEAAELRRRVRELEAKLRRAQLPSGDVTREEMLEAELDDLRSQFRRDRRADVARERILVAIENHLAHAAPPRRASAAMAPRPSKTAKHRQLLCLSDFHGGEVVDPEVVNGLNSFSWDVMEARVEQLIDGVLSHKQHSPELTGLDIGFIGDMCSGSNHDELAITNEFPLAEQAIRMGTLMGQIVERLAPHYPDVRCFAVEGNHPRLTKKPAAKNPHDNGDWVAAQFAAQYLRPYDNVSFTIGRGSLLWRIAGRTVYVWHSDGVRSSMPGVPWGGLMRRINAIQSQHATRIDHFLCGHWHTANVIQGGRLIVNGSLKGVDEWCLKSFGGGDPPTQLLVTFDERRERITDTKFLTPTAGIPGAAAA